MAEVAVMKAPALAMLVAHRMAMVASLRGLAIVLDPHVRDASCCGDHWLLPDMQRLVAEASCAHSCMGIPSHHSSAFTG